MKIDIRNIRGRWPENRTPLRPDDMLVSLREDSGAVTVRLDSKADDAFWLEFEVVMQPAPVGCDMV